MNGVAHQFAKVLLFMELVVDSIFGELGIVEKVIPEGHGWRFAIFSVLLLSSVHHESVKGSLPLKLVLIFVPGQKRSRLFIQEIIKELIIFDV